MTTLNPNGIAAYRQLVREFLLSPELPLERAEQILMQHGAEDQKDQIQAMILDFKAQIDGLISDLKQRQS